MNAEAVVFSIGPLAVSRAVATTWAVMLALTAACALVTRHLRLEPGRWQTVLEGVVSAIHGTIEQTLPGHGDRLMPFIGSLWIFLVMANLVGILPAMASPTGDLSTTTALAALVFVSVHWYGLTSEGPRPYLRHYLQPSPVMLPFHVISEISRTVALAVRLFGNVMSLETAAVLVLLVAGFLVPVPVLALHVVEALVQAYIFGMLALVYISGGIQSRQNRSSRNEAGASS